MKRTGCPSDVTEGEWAFVAPYLTLMREDAPQRDQALRAVFNAVRWIMRAGAPWRLLPNDLPPWALVYQQAQRWLRASVFETIAHDLRTVLRLAAGRAAEPTAAVLDTQALSSPASPHHGPNLGDVTASHLSGRAGWWKSPCPVPARAPGE